MELKNIQFEQALFVQGTKYIAGVDEVGRGPLAGPFVVAAAILDLSKILNQQISSDPARNNDVLSNEHNLYTDINDSKLVSRKKRDKINQFLLNEVISYSIVVIGNRELDHVGIGRATQQAFYQAIQKLAVKPQHILTDMFPIKQIPQEKQTNIPQGDKKSITIGAASIIAKVYRDALMEDYHKTYPLYGFDKNMGYGTKYHLQALQQHGPCEIHRRSFGPVKNWVPIPKNN
jgi:ribonuclease HII